MTEPKEQAVPVVGVEEAVERVGVLVANHGDNEQHAAWMSIVREALQGSLIGEPFFLSDDVMADIQRMWINQPSTRDTLHSLHGLNVLAVPETDRVFRVYFLSGPVISQQVPRNALSKGWK